MHYVSLASRVPCNNNEHHVQVYILPKSLNSSLLNFWEIPKIWSCVSYDTNTCTACIVFNAVKCNLTESTTKSISNLYESAVFCMCTCIRIPCALCLRCSCMCITSSRQFSLRLPSLFPLFIQCDGCLFLFLVWGLMAGLPEFASYGKSLHLGAGCQ